MKNLCLRMAAHLKGAAKDKSGVAMVEFAFSLPILMGVGMYGAETANVAVVNMRISQVALHISDNGSRIGEASVLSQRRIYESDINDLLLGANLQAGDYIGLYEHGRVIMSNLQRNSSGGQWISWQRCKGKKNHASTYGNVGDGATGTSFAGMGPNGNKITAAAGTAVIFVEISYDYQPLISSSFTNVTTINTRAAFNVRDNRDLTQIYNKTGNDPISSCTLYTGV